MKCNVGGVDRAIRISAGLVLIALTVIKPLPAWGWIGLVPLLTGLFRTCPAYAVLGLSSCPKS